MGRYSEKYLLVAVQKMWKVEKWGKIQQRENKEERNVSQCVIVRDSGCQGNRGGNPHSCCPANVTFKSYEEIVDTAQGFILESTFQVCFHA